MSDYAITFDGQSYRAKAGQTISEVLMDNGVITLGQTPDGTPRGVYCGMGACYQCRVILNGKMNIRACKTLAKPGDVVLSQKDVECGVE